MEGFLEKNNRNNKIIINNNYKIKRTPTNIYQLLLTQFRLNFKVRLIALTIMNNKNNNDNSNNPDFNRTLQLGFFDQQ